ncbi:MAG TPA: BTAD domain-containing putative transcriptional regulator [Chloroflexia bacterium]|nr:BTAD domain-containing putative transcriptional regulator [Chloroflexia bacterium]
MATNPVQSENKDADSWLAQATAEYQKLSASLSALGSQLAALGVTIQGQESAQMSLPPGPPLPLALPPPASESVSNAIKVNLLGSFRMSIGGHDLGPHVPGQVQTVLKFMMSQGGHPTSKDALLDLLWPESNPTITSSRLRVLMHTLRRSVACKHLGFGDLLVTSGNNFLVNPKASVWVDVDEFERRWHKGWRLARSGNKAEAMYEYEQAEMLYVGDYLEDDPYADWTLLKREALRDAYSTMLTMLSSMSIETGDYTGAIIWAQKLLAQDNCREDAYRLLMTSHHLLGQHSRSAYWYGLCVRALERELGLEPSQQTQELYKEIIGAGIKPSPFWRAI